MSPQCALHTPKDPRHHLPCRLIALKNFLPNHSIPSNTSNHHHWRIRPLQPVRSLHPPTSISNFPKSTIESEIFKYSVIRVKLLLADVITTTYAGLIRQRDTARAEVKDQTSGGVKLKKKLEETHQKEGNMIGMVTVKEERHRRLMQKLKELMELRRVGSLCGIEGKVVGWEELILVMEHGLGWEMDDGVLVVRGRMRLMKEV